MEQGTRRPLVKSSGYIVGYVAGYLSRKVYDWAVTRAKALLLEIDEAIASLDLGDVSHELPVTDDEFEEFGEQASCVCGSDQHASLRMVTTSVPAGLDNGEFGIMDVTAIFAYYETDPVAVQMTLVVEVVCTNGHVGTDSTTWAYALDLLALAFTTGGDKIVGEGDVTMRYDESLNRLTVILTDDDGGLHALDILEAATVGEFVGEALKVRDETGEQHLDNAIESLLDGTWQA